MNNLKYISITLAFLAWFTSSPVNAQQPENNSQPQAVPPSVPEINNSTTVLQSAYAEFMRLGYAAMQRQDYRLAAQYFRQALYYVPEDRAANIAYWNARDKISKQENTALQQETDYDRYMRIAYDATAKGDYQTALINFKGHSKNVPMITMRLKEGLRLTLMLIVVKGLLMISKTPSQLFMLASLPMIAICA